jgi:hypothetical protein
LLTAELSQDAAPEALLVITTEEIMTRPRTTHRRRAEPGLLPTDELLASIRGELKKTAVQRERELSVDTNYESKKSAGQWQPKN